MWIGLGAKPASQVATQNKLIVNGQAIFLRDGAGKLHIDEESGHNLVIPFCILPSIQLLSKETPRNFVFLEMPCLGML